jgi:hypothetical protein
MYKTRRIEMPYQTDERLKNYLDTNQLHREQMCRAILAIDKRYSDVRPRHPRGGPDGGRDIEALFRDDLLTFGAVGFVNQANDSDEHKKKIQEKFTSDLDSALRADKELKAFVFFTNINLTIGEKEKLIEKAKVCHLVHCEIVDRERMRIALDSPDGFSIRFQYLNIPLSEEEQASFFARWGDDIQSVISTGFQRLESTLNRVLFFQESTDPFYHLTVIFELKEKYSAVEIGHFRLFCKIYLQEPKLQEPKQGKVLEITFGSSDKSSRMRGNDDTRADFTEQKPGIKYGISSGQWERESGKKGGYQQINSSSSIGRDEVESLSIKFWNGNFYRYFSTMSLKDLDDAIFLPILNKSLAEKIKTIHLYSNDYKIQEIKTEDFRIDETSFDTSIPVKFTSEELEDSWVRIRPSKMSSKFYIQLFDKTPKRMFIPEQVENNLKEINNE